VAASAPVPAPTTTKAVLQTPSAPPMTPAERYDDAQRHLLENPEFQKSMRARQRAVIEFAYRELPRALGLSPEKASLVFDQLTEESMHQMHGATEAQKQAIETQLIELLGYDGVKRLEEFRAAIPSRAEVNNLRSNLASMGQPLRDEQIEPLLAVVRAQQQRLDREMRQHRETDPPQGYDVEGSRLMNAANSRILEDSRAFLTQQQFAALESYYRNQRDISEAIAKTTQMQIEQLNRDAQAGRPN